MLLAAIGDSIPMAAGIALSPLPIAIVLTILQSERPSNAPAFLLGWVSGIFGIGVIVFMMPGLDTAAGEPTPLSGWLRLLLGCILLGLAVWKWRRRPSADDAVEVPKMLSRLDTISGGKAVSVGFMASALNPKNLVLTFAAAAAIDASMATPSQQIVALTIYTVVASLSVVIPTISYSLFTDQIQPVLADWKDWLIRNNAVVVSVLLVVFGVLIIGYGLKVLSM